MAALKDFFISKVRVKLLKIFLEDPAKVFYVRELVRIAGEEINAVRRELERMLEAAMLIREKRGNRLYYGFNKNYLYYFELLQMVVKSTGLGHLIITQRNRIGKIKYAILSGRFARHKKHEENDVDLLIVGDIVMKSLSEIISDYEQKTKREINYSVMTKQEFDFRKKSRDPFIGQILMGSRIMLLGSEEEMVS